jgi:amidohydrolase
VADVDAIKQRVADEVDRRAELLVDASHQIHARPELCYEERFASDLLATICEGEGLTVERGAHGIETAFVARAGTGEGPTVAVLCEYDALPEIGHGCGHNIIATAGLGAGLAAASVVAEAGGRVVVIGTPAEEGGGGKIRLGDAGAFEGVDAAMMVHPAGVDRTEIHAIAIATWEVSYRGQAAHAAAFPHRGRNALDAAVLGYNAVAALRQHIRPTERIHGIFTHGGDKPNIVPERATAEWYVRSDTIRTLQPLKARVLACLEAGAAAAGCTMEHRSICPEYSDLRTNGTLIDLYARNSEQLGRPLADLAPDDAVVGSTDMGNVSYLVPSIHPMIRVSPPNVSIHSPEFAGYAAGPDGDRAVLDGAKAMAMTVVDLWLRPGAMAAVQEAFAGAAAVRDGSGREP